MKQNFLFALLLAFHLVGYSQKADTRPNFVLIIADDIGWNDFSCYGNQVVQTKNIDDLAENGMRFNNAFVTTSSCSPSRASIITGRYPHNTGAAELHTPLSPDAYTFPAALKQAGYATLHAGKWHMGEAAKKGFDISIEEKEKNGVGGEDQWVPLLQNRDRSKPFFAWLAAYDAHRPWEANPFQMVDSNFSTQLFPPYYVADSATRKDLVRYYNEVLRFDAFIGRVRDELAQQGVLYNTVIIVMADNGRPFPRDKTTLYDDGVKTPFVVSFPKEIKGKKQVCNALLSTIDIAPTLLELAGVTLHPSIQGRSFRSLFQNPKNSFRNYVFTEHNWHDYRSYERAVRTKDFLFIKNYQPTTVLTGSADLNSSPTYQSLLLQQKQGRLNDTQSLIFRMPAEGEEFYLVQTDPHQFNNQINNPDCQKEIARLKVVLEEWRQQTGDNQPANLTADWYNRETGKKLKQPEQRGEMPGMATKATQNNHKGPF